MITWWSGLIRSVAVLQTRREDDCRGALGIVPEEDASTAVVLPDSLQVGVAVGPTVVDWHVRRQTSGEPDKNQYRERLKDHWVFD